MPKRIHPQDQWETDFQVPLPGEPRNIGPLETLFQRLLNRTERLKSRFAAILGTAWDATPPDTLAGLAGRVHMLETSVSADPTPDTIARRNAQGSLQDGATHSLYKVVKVGGIYEWSAGNRWVQVAQWTLSPTGRAFRGVFADLHFTEPNTLGLGSRVRVRAYTNASGTFVNPAISISQDYLGGNVLSGIITNAMLVQTEPYTVELWVHSPARVVYVQGIIATNAESVVFPPYGAISDHPAPPFPISDGLYLDWSSVTADQTFVGPGNIVAASRNPLSGFVRYDNGMQICWASHEQESFGNVNTGNDPAYKYRLKVWTFPAAFISPPVVLASGDVAGARVDVINVHGGGDIAACLLEVGQYNAPDVNLNPIYTLAIGRWK